MPGYPLAGDHTKVLAIEGQNSFSDHFRELIAPVLEEVLREILPEKDVLDFHINFFSDAFICALERWLRDKNCVPPEEFIALLQSCLQIAAARSQNF